MKYEQSVNERIATIDLVKIADVQSAKHWKNCRKINIFSSFFLYFFRCWISVQCSLTFFCILLFFFAHNFLRFFLFFRFRSWSNHSNLLSCSIFSFILSFFIWFSFSCFIFYFFSHSVFFFAFIALFHGRIHDYILNESRREREIEQRKCIQNKWL